MRLRSQSTSFFCFVIALFALIAHCESDSEDEQPQKCPENTFLCPKENSCIPMDWMGDGEPDCEDGADEANTEKRTNVTVTKHKTKKLKVTASDPFAELATIAPKAGAHPAGCPAESVQRIEECTKDLKAWIDDISTTNFSQVSIFKDELSLAKIEQGCQLISDYSGCVDGLPASCHPPKGPLKDWISTQMYTCELLVPSLKEHLPCFNTARNEKCPTPDAPAKDSVVCSLVSSVFDDVNCVEAVHSEHCGDVAIELFAPMKSETEHVLEDLHCSAKETEEDTTSVVEEERQEPQQVHPGKPQAKDKSSESPAEDFSNSLYVFANIDAVCEKKADEMWKVVHTQVCHRKAELRDHAQCFMETAKKETKCATKLQRHTPCDAMHVFNHNVDCIIRTLNDLCPVEAQEVVVGIQDKLNDEAIALKCYQKDEETNQTTPINDDGFHLKPNNPRCTSEQENAALVCLVELVEINRQLTQFQSTNFLLEISDANSTLVTQICALYDKYEKCLKESVFVREGGRRCSFNSPLNTLARIGLSPVCSETSRSLLSENRECLLEISRNPLAAQCQSGLHNLGQTVNLMLQGIHGEALLCKSFYIIRQTFVCGGKLVEDQCDAKVANDLKQLKEKMTALGMEEGCPSEQPKDLEEIIARPVAPQAPMAHPLPRTRPHVPTAKVDNDASAVCEGEEQKQFSACIQPLTAFQPHPIAVIKQPRLIDNACEAFKTFKTCRSTIKCNPLWARGMSAMFEYACGEGYQRYTQVRQCVRRTTARNDIRECVTVFSKGAPQEACDSSNRLLSCALPPITEKCGKEAAHFVRDYVFVFSRTIDPNCSVDEISAIKAVHTINCTANQDQIVQQCAAPIGDITARLEGLFEGGQQSFLKNVNNLGPIFAEGCNLTKEFRECANPVLSHKDCVVSSCLLKAGDGICNRPNVSAAIDENLGCIFKQVSDPEFGKCLVTTLASLKQFNLVALRAVLPKFVSCVEPIVSKKCGEVPINVLKAVSSQDTCPIDLNPQSLIEPIVPVTEVPVCTDEMSIRYTNCTEEFYNKYSFEPIALVREDVKLDEMCAQAMAMTECIDKSTICETNSTKKALRRMISQICTTSNFFNQHRPCLSEVAQSSKGSECLSKYTSDENRTDYCSALSTASSCVAQQINEQCGGEALSYTYNAMNEYLSELPLNPPCTLTIPSVSLETGCSESHLIKHLECESLVDRFRFRPVTFISNASRWDEFCSLIVEKYRPCIDNLECRFEPVSTASLTLFENLCEREITRRDQRANAECLANVADSAKGKKCLEPFNEIDLLARDAGTKLCHTVNGILRCMADDIETKCGGSALLHVYDIHYTWVHAFNPNCSLSPENGKTKSETTAQFSIDQQPTRSTISSRQETSEAPIKFIGVHSHQEVALTTEEPSTQHAHQSEEPQEEPQASSESPVPEPEPEPEPEPTHETEPPSTTQKAVNAAVPASSSLRWLGVALWFTLYVVRLNF